MRNANKNTDDRKLIIVTVIIVIAAVGVFVYAYSQSMYGANYQKAIAAEGSDICATPVGYTDEQWAEHLGHHPDRYAQCLT